MEKNRGVRDNVQHTLITDLTEEEESIYKRIRKNYRYEIRYIEKEDVQLQLYTASDMNKNRELFSKFIVTYNQMYSSKGMNVRFNRPLVEEYMKNNAICFSIGFYKGEPLVFHSYIIDEYNVRFFYSALPFREKKEMSTIIGQMNKALHWFDIKSFRKMGISQYDWGGIANPENPNGIDLFKIGFGGQNRSYYNTIKGVSIKGRIPLLLNNMINRTY